MDLIIGIAIGASFAPFWTLVWNKWIKPAVSGLLKKD
jgi:hypothetical protein